MSMTFPDLESLTTRAKMRNFRQPFENESEDNYRTAFADYVQDVDMVEAAEIRLGSMPLDFAAEADPLTVLSMLAGRSRNDMLDMFKDAGSV